MSKILEKPLAELPFLGWTQKIHKKLGELTPSQVAIVAMGRAERFVLSPDSSRHRLLKADKAASALLKSVVESRAQDGLQFVQIGAHNGEFDDPFADFIATNNWRALLVEPQPHLYKQLDERYRDNPAVSCANVAISDKAQPMTLWRAEVEGYAEFGAAIASMNKQQVEREVRRNLGTYMLHKTTFVPEVVPAIPLGELFDAHNITPDSIDFFACDTEGHDATIVKSLIQDVGATPPLIQWEHFHVNPLDVAQTEQNLVGLGYQMVKTHKDVLAYR